jgi:hypothetical protein
MAAGHDLLVLRGDRPGSGQPELVALPGGIRIRRLRGEEASSTDRRSDQAPRWLGDVFS